MKFSVTLCLAALVSDTLAAFVSPKGNVKRATFALYSESDDGKKGPWLSGEVDGNGHIIDSNLPVKFRRLQMNYESDCQPTWKRSPNPPKTTADFLQHLEAVRIGEEVGKPVKRNVMQNFEKPASSWISQVPRRPLEGDISVNHGPPASDGVSPASTDFRTKMVPENRPSSVSAWIDHKPRKPLEGDFTVHQFDMEEKKSNSQMPSSGQSGKPNNILYQNPASSIGSKPSAFVPSTPLPITPPGVAARFSQEYHSGHHPSWSHFSTSDALIQGSTLKQIRITEQSPFYLSQPSAASDETMPVGQDSTRATPSFVEAEFEEDELASEVTKLREMAMEAAEVARVAEMAAAEKSQQARKASEEARLAEINAVEKAIAARDAAQTARLALENMRKVREEEAARLAEETRLEALREKEEQARLEALARKRELERQEEIARAMKKEQEALLQRQRDRAKQEEIAAQVKREQEALMERQRERTRQDNLALQMKQEQEELLERQREWARQEESARQIKDEQDALTKLQHERVVNDENEDAVHRTSREQTLGKESVSQSQTETGRLREEFRLAQIAKKKTEGKQIRGSKAAVPVTDRRPAEIRDQNTKDEVQRLLDLAINKQKNFVRTEEDQKPVSIPAAPNTIDESSTSNEFQNNMKSSFRRHEMIPRDDVKKGPIKKSSTSSSMKESPGEKEKVLRTNVEKAMKQKNDSGNGSKTRKE